VEAEGQEGQVEAMEVCVLLAFLALVLLDFFSLLTYHLPQYSEYSRTPCRLNKKPQLFNSPPSRRKEKPQLFDEPASRRNKKPRISCEPA
jgi:hypothetical protein